MIVALSLLAYGGLLALLGPRLIRRLPAARRVPRLGALLWQVAAVTVVASWVVAGVAITTPLPALHELAHLLRSCLDVAHEAAPSPAPSRTPQIAGLALSVAVLGRVGGCVVAGAVDRHRRRLRHARMLRIVARQHLSSAPSFWSIPMRWRTACPVDGGRRC